MRSLLFYHAMALVTCLLWSFSYMHVIWLSQYAEPVGVVALRFDFFAIAVVGLWIWRRPRLRDFTGRQWVLLVVAGFVSGPGYHLPLAWAGGDGRIDAALMGLIIATIPVHAGWLAWVALGERLNWAKGLGLLLGLSGVMVVIIGRNGGIDFLPNQLAGPIATTVAAILGAGIATVNRASRTVCGPLDFVAVTGAIGVVLVLVIHPFAGLDVLPVDRWQVWWAGFYLGFVALGIAYVTWVTALSGLETVTVAMYLFLTSVLSALWGWIWQDNEIGWPFAAGAALVLAGLATGAGLWKRRPATLAR